MHQQLEKRASAKSRSSRHGNSISRDRARSLEADTKDSTRNLDKGNENANQYDAENAMFHNQARLYKFTTYMGWLTLWTPFAILFSHFRPVTTITLFYCARCAENTLLLIISILWFFYSGQVEADGELFSTRSFAFSLVCILMVLVIYFWKIAPTMKKVEAMNLDIFGVIHAAKEDIDLFRRFLKRAAHKVHDKRGLFVCLIVYCLALFCLNIAKV